MKTKTYLLYILFLLFPAGIYAQPDTIQTSAPPGAVQHPNGLARDADGNIWITTGYYRYYNLVPLKGTGAFRFNMIEWKNYKPSNNTVASDNVYAMHMDVFKRLWFGTDKGISRYQNNQWVQVNRANSSLGCDTILSIASAGNYFYIGTANGLFTYNGFSFTRYDSTAWGLGSNEISSLLAASDGTLWMGTPKGIISYKNGQWKSFTKNNSAYVSGYIKDIKEDGLHRIWISAYNSIDINSVPHGAIYLIENGQLSTVAERFGCDWGIFPQAGGQLAVNDKGDVFIGVIMGQPYGPRMLKISGESVTRYQYYSKPGVWCNLLYSDGYIWKTDRFNYSSLERFNYDAYEKTNLTATYRYLDINKVQAGILANADMFNDLSGKPTYQDKDHPCRNMFYSSSIRLGGLDDGGNLHLSAMTYRQKGVDFTPGPLDTVTAQIGKWIDFNHVWKISRSDIETFKEKFADGSVTNGTYTIPADILSWPAHGPGKFSRRLAPFVDHNGDGVYNPKNGDHPLIKGDQMLFWVFNDNIFHSETGGVPLKVEVQASAYAYNCDMLPESSPLSALNRTTFYEYRVINRSNMSYHDLIMGVFADTDLGFYGDDYVGCNPKLNAAFVYNSDPDDEGLSGFGDKVPVANIILLSDTMNSFMCFMNAAPYPQQDPNNAIETYNYLKHRFQNGQSLKFGGNGLNGTADCNFAFPGNNDPAFPGQTWTEASASNKPGDRRVVLGAKPVTFGAGEERTFSYAIMHTPNTILPDGSLNKSRIEAIHNFYRNSAYLCQSSTTGTGKLPASVPVRVYPNPSKGSITFEYHVHAAATVSLKIYNMLGQEVYVMSGGLQTPGQQQLHADLSALPEGVYVYELVIGKQSLKNKIIISQ